MDDGFADSLGGCEELEAGGAVDDAAAQSGLVGEPPSQHTWE